MEDAIRLSVAVKGAVMPDAHHGFGLPIGEVVATERINAGFSCNELVKAL